MGTIRIRVQSTLIVTGTSSLEHSRCHPLLQGPSETGRASRAAFWRCSAGSMATGTAAANELSQREMSKSIYGSQATQAARNRESEVRPSASLPQRPDSCKYNSITVARTVEMAQPVKIRYASATSETIINLTRYGRRNRKSNAETAAMMIPRCIPLSASRCDTPLRRKCSVTSPPSAERSPSSSAAQSAPASFPIISRSATDNAPCTRDAEMRIDSSGCSQNCMEPTEMICASSSTVRYRRLPLARSFSTFSCKRRSAICAVQTTRSPACKDDTKAHSR